MVFWRPPPSRCQYLGEPVQLLRRASTYSSIDVYVQSLIRISKAQLSNVMPLRNELSQVLLARIQDVGVAVRDVLQALPTVGIQGPLDRDSGEGDTSSSSIAVYATANCWSRSARRRCDREGNNEAGNVSKAAVLRCSISWASMGGAIENEVLLNCRWAQGRERELFESFWSHVSRKTAVALQQHE